VPSLRVRVPPGALRREVTSGRCGLRRLSSDVIVAAKSRAWRCRRASRRHRCDAERPDSDTSSVPSDVSLRSARAHETGKGAAPSRPGASRSRPFACSAPHAFAGECTTECAGTPCLKAGNLDSVLLPCQGGRGGKFVPLQAQSVGAEYARLRKSRIGSSSFSSLILSTLGCPTKTPVPKDGRG
jgi:hypothetical protein